MVSYDTFPAIAQWSTLADTCQIKSNAKIPMERDCPDCGGIGYFLVYTAPLGNRPVREAAASCTTCERGRFLRSREKHPIVTRAEAARQGYVVVKKLQDEPQKMTRQMNGEMVPEAWVSKQAPGTPASIEALCVMIKDGKAGQKGWNFGLDYVGLTEDQIWAVYESWAEGKVHPLANGKP